MSGFAALALSLALPSLCLNAQDNEDANYYLSEVYREILMPPEFRIEATVLDGPVFANADGKTLYKWPQHRLRNGYSGEAPDTPECYDEVITVTAGLMSPYPPGIQLPQIDSRPSCTDLWPPVLASENSEAIGKWTIVARKDGTQQWAFDEQPLYTSVRDEAPGDVLGGTTRRFGGDSPAKRMPIGPPTYFPPGFAVKTTTIGRLITTDKNESVYAFDQDSADKSACIGSCLNYWQPVIAPMLARSIGEWSVFERTPGIKQWAYRDQPLYTHSLDSHSYSQQGSDVPGWSNVFTQLAPKPPASFTVQATLQGNVLASPQGKSIYIYNCGEDSADQLACDHPESTQVYRLAMCGAGDPKKCLEFWPYVVAADNETSANRLWRIITIDPMTGRFAEPDQENSLRVWAYRGKPVYTYGGDQEPGQVNGGGTGEWRGQRNGLRAFWLRDDYMNGIL